VKADEPQVNKTIKIPKEDMNSLTTVGGTVINAEEFDVDQQEPKSRRTRMNVVRRVRSVDDHHHGGDFGHGDLQQRMGRKDAAVDAVDEPIRSTARGGATHTRATLPPATLDRHRSAPSRTTIDNDELDVRPPRAEYSANTRRFSSRVRASTLVPESREPVTTILDTSSHTLPNDTSSRTSRVSFEAPPSPLGLPSPSKILSPVALAAKQSILHTLQNLSQSESYATSPYFQRIFNQGMANVKQYSEELRDVEDALHMCFEVNEDMVHVIAGAASAAVEKEAMERAAVQEEPSAAVGMDAQVMGQRMATYRQSKPREEPRNGNDYGRVDESLGRSVVSNPRQLSASTDLSGYIQRGTQKSHGHHDHQDLLIGSSPAQYQDTEHYREVNTSRSNLTHALSLPLPPTLGMLQPLTPDELDVATLLHYGTDHLSTARTPQEGLGANYRKEKARHRVQQYLERIDDRVKSVKVQGLSNNRSTVKRVHSHDFLRSASGIALGDSSGAMHQHEQQVRPWDSFDVGMRTGERASAHHGANNERGTNKRLVHDSGPRMKQQLFLPSLETPGGLEQQPQTMSSSVFRANVAVVEEARAEAASLAARMGSIPFDESGVQRRDDGHYRGSRDTVGHHPDQRQDGSLPFDESDVQRRDDGHHQSSRDTAGHHLDGNRTAYESYLSGSISSSNDDNAIAPEQRIKAIEKSVGLKSLQEYKELLKQKTLEVEGLEHRFQTQMEQNEEDVGVRDDEIQQFKMAMKEAERAVAALEETIQHLEEASNEKDELIKQLRTKVKVLENELEKSNKSNLQKEIEHQEHIRMLNESISQMGAAVKKRDGSISSFQTKMEELEAELAKTLVQFNSSQAAVANAQKTFAKKDQRLKAFEQELTSTKELQQGQMDLFKNEISSSLENTTQLMDLMSKEKDSLIDSLNAKIPVLEQSVAELEEEKEQGGLLGVEKENELNEKIHTLALALTEKDRQIGVFQKEADFNQEIENWYSNNN